MTATPAAVLKKLTERMEGALTHLQRELATLRTGRASVTLLDGVTVEYFGARTPLKQMATLSTPESRLIMIQAWDVQAIPAIEKAILAANLGLTPSNDGKVVRVSFPPLTEEHRKEMGRIGKKLGEETKVTLRTIRHEALNELKPLQKAGNLSEDDARRNQDEIQKAVDRFTQRADEAVRKKEKEILEV